MKEATFIFAVIGVLAVINWLFSIAKLDITDTAICENLKRYENRQK